jgi:hypothetical protein
LSETPLWFLIIQLLTTLTLLATFIAYLAQLRLMQKQVDASRESTLAQNTLAVVQFIQQPDFRASRGYVMKNLDKKAFEDWTQEDHRHAGQVCWSWDAVGLLVGANIADRNLIVDNWRASILKAYMVLVPHIAEIRRNLGVPSYWGNFEWLAHQAGLEAAPWKPDSDVSSFRS